MDGRGRTDGKEDIDLVEYGSERQNRFTCDLRVKSVNGLQKYHATNLREQGGSGRIRRRRRRENVEQVNSKEYSRMKLKWGETERRLNLVELICEVWETIWDR